MNICMIISTPLPAREGIGIYSWNLARELITQGHQVQFITRGGPGPTTRSIIAGIPVWHVTFWPLYPFHVHWHGQHVNRLIRQIEAEIDLFHLHTPLVARPQTNRPWLVTVHSLMEAASAAIQPNSLLNLLIKLQTPFSVKLEQQLLPAAGAVGSVSRASAAEIRRSYPGIQPCVYANGVDQSIFTPDGHRADPEFPYALTVGRLSPGKGLETLLACAPEIFQRYPNFRFLLAGQGPLENWLRKQIERIGLAENILLLGQITNRERLAELYRGASLYIHPSHYEGLPTVILEAMACGCPVIATKTGGIPDVVEAGKNGLLVSPANPAELARAILSLLDEPAEAAQMGHRAAQTAQQYTWPIITRKYIDTYAQLLEKKS